VTVDDEQHRRREAFDRKHAHLNRSLSALASLRERIAPSVAIDVKHGGEWLQHSGVHPLVDVRCSRGHKLGGVWATSEGGLFVAWPSVSRRYEAEAGRWIATESEDSRRRLVADLVAEEAPFALDDKLLVACPCRGVRELPPGTRAKLASSFQQASRSRAVKWRLDEGPLP